MEEIEIKFPVKYTKAITQKLKKLGFSIFHRCPLKPSSPLIAILCRLTLELSHALLAVQRGIGSIRHEGT